MVLQGFDPEPKQTALASGHPRPPRLKNAKISFGAAAGSHGLMEGSRGFLFQRAFLKGVV